MQKPETVDKTLSPSNLAGVYVYRKTGVAGERANGKERKEEAAENIEYDERLTSASRSLGGACISLLSDIVVTAVLARSEVATSLFSRYIPDGYTYASVRDFILSVKDGGSIWLWGILARGGWSRGVFCAAPVKRRFLPLVVGE